MKILMISDLSPPVVMGGIETYVVSLSKELIKQGHEVHWLTSKLPGTKSEETYEGINVYRVSIPFSNHYQFPGRQLFSISSLIKGIKLAKEIDVVHVNTLVPGFLGWIIAKYSGKPSVLFCHEFYDSLWNKIGQNFLEKYGYPIFEKLSSKAPYDWYACPSEYSKQTLVRNGVPENKITVIKHGIDHQSFSNFKRDYREIYSIEGPTFGYLGRLSTKGTGQAKNILGLLEASKYVFEKIPNAKLILGGKGFDNLKSHIQKLGIENNVIHIENIPKDETSSFLKACDVVVCPALSDGFCFLLAESSASGIPIVATNLGSHNERIIQNENGLLTEPTPEKIADGIITILDDKNLGNTFGRNGINVTDDLSWEESAKNHLDMYQKLIHK